MANKVEIILEGVDEATGVISGVEKALGGLADVGKGVLTIGLGAATAAAGGLAAGLSLAVSEALDAQKTQARLAQIIKATGGAAGLTTEKANELAQQFKNLAGGSDDEILALETIGLQAGTIAADQMPAFIQSALDLGAVLGDNATAAELLARAQEDPLFAMGRLQRAGIVFSASLEDQIKEMVKSGDTAGATALIMDRLAEATAGAAQSNADTLAGKWEILKGRLLDAAEGIGTKLLPVLTDFFDNVIAPNLPKIEAFAEQIGIMAGNIATAIQNGTLADLIPPGIVENIQPLIDAIDNLNKAFMEQLPAMKEEGQKFMDWLAQAFNETGPQTIENLADSINTLAEFWREWGDEIMTVTRVVAEVLVTTLAGAIELLSGIISAGLTFISGNVKAWSQIFAGDWQGMSETIIVMWGEIFETLGETLSAFFDMAASITGSSLEKMIADWRGAFELLVVIVTTVMGKIIRAIQDQFTIFMSLGVELAKNIEKGLILYTSQIISTVTGMVKQAVGAATSALGGAVSGALVGGAPGFAGGGSFVVPPGFPNDSFLMRVQSGEHVNVTPAGQSQGGGGPLTLIVQMNGQTLFETTVAEAQARGLIMVQAA